MKRVSVDIGGTFTDCFLAWGNRKFGGKALTTHHNLAIGFNKALMNAAEEAGLQGDDFLGEIESIRYATTLGTNALIEHNGPRVGLLVTAGFEATVPLSRGRGYGDSAPVAVEQWQGERDRGADADHICGVASAVGADADRQKLRENGGA